MKLLTATLGLAAMLAVTAPASADGTANIPEAAFKAALQGPAKKGITMYLDGSTINKYVVKPVTIFRRGGLRVVTGRLSLDRSRGKDHEILYEISAFGRRAPTTRYRVKWGGARLGWGSETVSVGPLVKDWGNALLTRLHEAPTVSGAPRVEVFTDTGLRGLKKVYEMSRHEQRHPRWHRVTFKRDPSARHFHDKVSSMIAVVPTGYELLLQHRTLGKGTWLILDLHVWGLNDTLNGFRWNPLKNPPDWRRPAYEQHAVGRPVGPISGMNSGRGGAARAGMTLRRGAQPGKTRERKGRRVRRRDFREGQDRLQPEKKGRKVRRRDFRKSQDRSQPEEKGRKVRRRDFRKKAGDGSKRGRIVRKRRIRDRSKRVTPVQ